MGPSFHKWRWGANLARDWLPLNVVDGDGSRRSFPKESRDDVKEDGCRAGTDIGRCPLDLGRARFIGAGLCGRKERSQFGTEELEQEKGNLRQRGQLEKRLRGVK